MTVDVSEGGVLEVNEIAPSSYPAQYTFGNGESVVLEAIPDYQYVFNGWSGDLTGTANPSIIVMNCDENITADFSLNKTLVAELVGITTVIALLIIITIIVRY
ncbi:hypothetical protein ACFLT8_05690 [Chloroflexota bacterium]